MAVVNTAVRGLSWVVELGLGVATRFEVNVEKKRENGRIKGKRSCVKGAKHQKSNENIFDKLRGCSKRMSQVGERKKKEKGSGAGVCRLVVSDVVARRTKVRKNTERFCLV